MQIHLMYHDVFEHDPCESGFLQERDLPYKISAVEFEKHIKAISEYCSQKGLPKDYVVFTFDDGGKSFSQVIAPILERYGYRGLFFISTNYIGTDTFLTEDEIRELHQKGHIIGSHAHHHVHMYSLTEEEVQCEWSTSVKILQNIIGAPIAYASIPNGDMSKTVLNSVSACGIKHIYTSEPVTKISVYNDMEVIGRYVLLVNSTTEYVQSIISSSRRRMALSLKRSILKVVKSILGSSYLKLKNILYR